MKPTEIIATIYKAAKITVIKRGYAAELEWQKTVDLKALEPQQFMQDYAWVAYCSGFRESIVRKKWLDILEAYDNLDPVIVADFSVDMKPQVLALINHEKKFDGIVWTAKWIRDEDNFKFIKKLLLSERSLLRKVNKLTIFPYIGNITKYHLAKNLGLQVAKPDRHLVRIADFFGYKDVQKFCEDIATETNDPVPVVDIVWWRFATLTPNYLTLLKGESR